MMRRSSRLIGLAACWLSVGVSARAGQVVYRGIDPGMGPGQSAPNTVAAQTAFRTAIGASPLIDFEAAPLGHFTSQELLPGVTLTLSNTDSTPPPGFHYGIANDNQGPLLGYNTSPGGSQFLRVSPLLDVGTVTLQFDFAQPIEAFGFTITGLGVHSGPLYVSYGAGAGGEETIGGDPDGGILFFGISGLSTPATRVSLQLREVSGDSRDIFGLDDFRFKAFSGPGGGGDPPTTAIVPETSTIVLAGLGLPALAAVVRQRRRAS
jgi:hypothetical protein